MTVKAADHQRSFCEQPAAETARSLLRIPHRDPALRGYGSLDITRSSYLNASMR
jgi:hypothetical protein